MPVKNEPPRRKMGGYNGHDERKYEQDYRTWLRNELDEILAEHANELGTEVQTLDPNKFYMNLFDKTITIGCITDRKVMGLVTAQVRTVHHKIGTEGVVIVLSNNEQYYLCEHCRWVIAPDSTPLSNHLKDLMG